MLQTPDGAGFEADLMKKRSGGPSGIRTLDLRIKSPLLCQLS